jgi:hypothetical protein
MFQAGTGILWSYGASDNGASSFSVMAGTSPSVVQLAGGGYEAAWQNPDGDLMVWGPGQLINDGPMMAGTSPGIAALGNGSWLVAYIYTSGNVITAGPADGSVTDWGPAAPGTSPSITGFENEATDFEVAYQDTNGDVHLLGSFADSGLALGMMAGTSPSVAVTG